MDNRQRTSPCRIIELHYVEDIEIDGAFYDSNLAQIVYEYSGGVLPRTMERYDRLKPSFESLA